MTPLPVPNGYSIQQVIAINDQDVTIGTATTASAGNHCSTPTAGNGSFTFRTSH